GHASVGGFLGYRLVGHGDAFPLGHRRDDRADLPSQVRILLEVVPQSGSFAPAMSREELFSQLEHPRRWRLGVGHGACSPRWPRNASQARLRPSRIREGKAPADPGSLALPILSSSPEFLTSSLLLACLEVDLATCMP